MVEPLRRVLVRPPHPAAGARWREYGWRAKPDPTRLGREHEAFFEILSDAGAEVVVAEPIDDDPDAVYAFDPAIATEHGVVLLRPGKTGRRAEVAATEAACVEAGVPIAGRLDGPATAEGGDFIRLDAETLLAGRSYRTNAEGIDAVAASCPESRHWPSTSHTGAARPR